MSGIPGMTTTNHLVEKPFRFTDSPQHYPSITSSGGGSNAPTPSPRRKNSTSSANENAYSELSSRLASSSSYGHSDYGPSVYSTQQDYFRPIDSSGYFTPSDYQWDSFFFFFNYPPITHARVLKKKKIYYFFKQQRKNVRVYRISSRLWQSKQF